MEQVNEICQMLVSKALSWSKQSATLTHLFCINVQPIQKPETNTNPVHQETSRKNLRASPSSFRFLFASNSVFATLFLQEVPLLPRTNKPVPAGWYPLLYSVFESEKLSKKRSRPSALFPSNLELQGPTFDRFIQLVRFFHVHKLWRSLILLF